MLKEELNAVLDTLTQRERKVIELRFGLDGGHPRTLEEVGQEFGVTRERIRQIEAKTLVQAQGVPRFAAAAGLPRVGRGGPIRRVADRTRDAEAGRRSATAHDAAGTKELTRQRQSHRRPPA